MIIRAKTLRQWFDANLSENANDIANHGADAGYPGITYTRDIVHLYDRFADEIWKMAVRMAEETGHKNVAAMVAGWRRADMLETVDGFKNLMVWFACETLASEESGQPPSSHHRMQSLRENAAARPTGGRP